MRFATNLFKVDTFVVGLSHNPMFSVIDVYDTRTRRIRVQHGSVFTVERKTVTVIPLAAGSYR